MPARRSKVGQEFGHSEGRPPANAFLLFHPGQEVIDHFVGQAVPFKQLQLSPEGGLLDNLVPECFPLFRRHVPPFSGVSPHKIDASAEGDVMQ